ISTNVCWLRISVTVFGCSSSNSVPLSPYSQGQTLSATDVIYEQQRTPGISERCRYRLYAQYNKKAVANLVDQDQPEHRLTDGLSCNFDTDDEHCKWHNNPNFKIGFQRGYFVPNFDLNRYLCTDESAFPLDNVFLVASGGPATDYYEGAIEAQIPCLSEFANVKLNFWTNGEDVLLRACVITQEDGLVECFGLKFDKNPVEFLLNKTNEVFTLRIEVDFLQKNEVAIIDDILFNAKFCSENLEEPEEKYASDNRIEVEGLLPIEDQTADNNRLYSNFCRSIACDFNQDSNCEYGNAENIPRNMWKLGFDQIGNPLTGVKKTEVDDSTSDGFAYVGKEGTDQCQNPCVLVSPLFDLTNPVYLVFDLFLRSVGPKLQVCINNEKFCPYSNPEVSASELWFYNQTVLLPTWSRKVGCFRCCSSQLVSRQTFTLPLTIYEEETLTEKTCVDLFNNRTVLINNTTEFSDSPTFLRLKKQAFSTFGLPETTTRTLECKTVQGHDQARCVLYEEGKTLEMNPECFEKTEADGANRVYCRVFCEESDDTTVLKKIPNWNHQCNMFYTYNLNRFRRDWYIWRSQECLNTTISFVVRCGFHADLGSFYVNNPELFSKEDEVDKREDPRIPINL
ncbi:unnamed protein product, partial [Enterobius vermicularis]|uniref:MAM domain-containing protein n=1 Tax=Enterobius vermicularis TaxID=51028 RepID=A0A0N4USS1_ENTVE